MKKYLLIFVFLGLVKTGFTQQAIDTLKVKVSAQCETCKETLEKAMAYEKGVKKSDLDLKTMVLTVFYKTEKTNPEKIRNSTRYR